MKKLSRKRKEFLIINAQRIAKHERSRRSKKRAKLRINIPAKIKEERNRAFIDNPGKVTHENIIAPPTFSLLKDPISALGVIDLAGKALSSGSRVKFDLTNVREIGPETLLYYCALFNDPKFTKGLAMVGNLPIDQEVVGMFKNSGFLNFVKSNKFYPVKPNDIYDEIMHGASRVKVEPKIAGEVVRNSIRYTYESEDISKQKLYPILIECMGNTFNHANFANKLETYNWWLLAYKEPVTKITKFCFLDLGIGIFGSLNQKYKANKITGFLKGKVFPNNNEKTLREIFAGENKTSTNEQDRGLGINNIYNQIIINPYIDNFTMISNDIFAKIDYNAGVIIEKLSKNFSGTLYYWEILPKNE